MDAGHTNVLAVAVVLSAVCLLAVLLHVFEVYNQKFPQRVLTLPALYVMCLCVVFVVLLLGLLVENNQIALLLLGATMSVLAVASYGIGVEIETKRPQQHVIWLLAAAALLSTGTATAASTSQLHVTRLAAAWGFATLVTACAWFRLSVADFKEPKNAAKHKASANNLEVTLPGHSGDGGPEAGCGGQEPGQKHRRAGDSPGGTDACN